jgi:acetyltransferase-like isoleucine patch superfamily enzyme
MQLKFRQSRIIRYISKLSFISFLKYRGIKLGSGIHLDVSGKFYYGTGCSIGKNSTLVIPLNSKVTIGNDCYLGRNVEVGGGGFIHIGDRTSIQDRCFILGNVKIGCNCIFSYNVYISSGRHLFNVAPYLPIKYQDNILSANEKFNGADESIYIGDDCFVGINVVIMPGVTIGNGAVIGSNSVVLRDVKPYMIVAGSPAREIKNRLEFSPPELIDSENKEHYPYFYTGFQIGKNYLYDRGIGRGFICKKNFVLSLDTRRAKSIHLEIAPTTINGFKLIMNGRYKLMVESISKELVFKVEGLVDQLLYFEIQGEDHMESLEIKKAWIEGF